MRAAVKQFIEEIIDLIEDDKWSDVAYKAETWLIDRRFLDHDMIEFWEIVREDLNIDILKFENIKVVPSHYFYNSDIVEIDLPEHILHISRAAFTNCKNLEKVLLPTSLISVGEDAFVNTSKLKNIYYNGYLADFKKIRLGWNAFGVNILGRNDKNLIAKDGVTHL